MHDARRLAKVWGKSGALYTRLRTKVPRLQGLGLLPLKAKFSVSVVGHSLHLEWD